MILRDRCSTSYDLALVRQRAREREGERERRTDGQFLICKTKAQKQGSPSHLAGFLQFLRKIAPKREQPFTKVAAKLVALQMRHGAGVVQSYVQSTDGQMDR